MAQGNAPNSYCLSVGEVSFALTIFSLLEADASSIALFHCSYCLLLQQFQSSTRSYHCWLSGWSVLALQECITHLQTRWWSSSISILPPLWMRSVQDLQKQVPTTAEKKVSVIKMENSCVLGFIWPSLLCFPNPWRSVSSQLQDLILSLMLQLLKQFWPPNSEIRIGEKGEVIRKANTVMFMI